MKRNYVGYDLNERSKLLSVLSNMGYPPKYDNVILEHITYLMGTKVDAPDVNVVRVIGHLMHDGVQCVLVEIDGNTDRPNGQKYHITYSLDVDKKPKMSNDIIECAIDKADMFDHPIEINVTKF